MARHKKIVEEHENHERWLVSYADFVTLLFAFFVVMYAVSSVNEGKYRVLSNSLEEAFSDTKRSMKPIQIGEVPKGQDPIKLSPPVETEPPLPLEPDLPESDKDDLADEVDRERKRLMRVAEQIEEVLFPYIDQELIEVKRDDFWIEVEMKSGILFGSGSADLEQEAFPVLKKLAEIFRELPNALQVEGHTDNFPIQTFQFPSNWELSAARAASVVRQFVQFGINPQRMSATGYGEYHPVGDNKFEEGRYKNRRVVLVLLSLAATRHNESAGERTKLLATTPKIPPRGQQAQSMHKTSPLSAAN
ncbi:MAG: flagellar motor protein MotD [Pseudomonadota bacterium]